MKGNLFYQFVVSHPRTGKIVILDIYPEQIFIKEPNHKHLKSFPKGYLSRDVVDFVWNYLDAEDDMFENRNQLRAVIDALSTLHCFS